MGPTNHDQADWKLEQMLGNLLRVGVIIAAVLVLIGGGIYLVRHGQEEVDLDAFKGEPPQYRRPPDIVREAWDLRGRGLIMLGLLVLIATPVARVAFSAAGFVWERDGVYVAVTLTVLALLLFSLFVGSP
jgi:uncharacterized membrane protein